MSHPERESIVNLDGRLTPSQIARRNVTDGELLLRLNLMLLEHVVPSATGCNTVVIEERNRGNGDTRAQGTDRIFASER